MFESIRNGIITIIAMIIFFYGLVELNNYGNNIKKERCENMGGTFVLNVSDFDQSTCILKK